jgi:hypothetical protein
MAKGKPTCLKIEDGKKMPFCFVIMIVMLPILIGIS